MITSNRGGWGESYIATKVLQEGFVHAINEEGEVAKNAGLRVLGVRREDSNLTCWRNGRRGCFELTDENLKHVRETSFDKFRENSTMLFQDIMGKKGASFSSEAGDQVLRSLGFSQAQAPSRRKSDLVLVVADQYTREPICLNCSAKSVTSSNPSVLNSSKATGVLMSVGGIDWEQASLINETTKGMMACVKEVLKKNGTITPHSIPHSTFKQNLLMIGESSPTILLELIKHYALGHGPGVPDLTEAICRDEEFMNKHGLTREMLILRVKKILFACFTGMTPGTKWNGENNVNGGMLILCPSGEVYFLRLNDLDSAYKYLYENMKFDCPDPNRYPIGTMRREGDEILMSLNFQIRWVGGLGKKRKVKNCENKQDPSKARGADVIDYQKTTLLALERHGGAVYFMEDGKSFQYNRGRHRNGWAGSPEASHTHP